MFLRPDHARKSIPARLQIILLLAAVLQAPSCADTSYRFERIDGTQSVPMSLKLAAVTGLRDGASVRADIRFADGADSGRMSIVVALVPPPQFSSGAYQLTVGGQTMEGVVDCTSLSYLGGQNDQPSIGGVFVLKDSENRPLYRVRIPATVMTRKLEF